MVSPDSKRRGDGWEGAGWMAGGNSRSVLQKTKEETGRRANAPRPVSSLARNRLLSGIQPRAVVADAGAVLVQEVEAAAGQAALQEDAVGIMRPAADLGVLG